MSRLFSLTRRQQLAAGLVLAALILPWMSPVHPAPLADWFTDAITLTFIALACLIPLPAAQGLVITRTMMMGWGMVLVVAALSVLHQPAYPAQTWMPVGLFLAMILLSSRVRDLTATPELRTQFLDALAAALLLSAMVQAVIGFAQYTGLANLGGGWIVHDPGKSSSVVMGNISQRNVFAHMLALGVVSACWLYARGRVRALWLVPMVAFIALSMAWCGARLPLAYGGGLALLGLWWWLRARHDAAVARFCQAAWVAGAIVLLMQWGGAWLAQLLWQGAGVGQTSQSGFSRLLDVAPTLRRWVEWEKSLEAFAQHPIVGLGWGGGASYSAYAEAFGDFTKVADDTLCLHAHNLVIQLLAETGLVGVLVGVGGIVWCLWPCVKRPTVESVFLLGLAMVTLTHSQFEYPLWYVTGLATFVVVLACASPEPLSKSMFQPLVRRLAAVLVSVFLLVYTVTGVSAFYAVCTAFVTPAERWSPGLAKKLEGLQTHPLWMFEVELVYVIHMLPFGGPMDAKRAMLERQAAYRPYGPVLFKLAMVQAIQNDLPAANKTMDLMLASFPSNAPAFLDYAKHIPDPSVEPIRQRLAQFIAERAAAQAASRKP